MVSTTNEQKEKDFGVPVSCIIGGGVWWFLASGPSHFALIVSGFFLGYLFLGYCVLAVLLPGPDEPERKESFVPIPQSEMGRQKALTL